MKLFLDSANIEEIKNIASLGILDGLTTNPTLIAKSGKDIYKLMDEICSIVNGDVSVEVASNEYEYMIREGQALSEISQKIVIKLPVTWDGIKACKYFSEKGKKTNLTLCFSVTQALIAAKAGATYISPFVGRLDDCGSNGLNLIKDIITTYKNYPIDTKVLAASIRSVVHVREIALMGVCVATLPQKTILDLISHPLTNIGLENFNNDWKKSGLKI